MKFPFTTLLFLLAEAFANFTLVHYIPTLRTDSPLAVLHWVITAVCVCLHFVASFKKVPPP